MIPTLLHPQSSIPFILHDIRKVKFLISFCFLIYLDGEFCPAESGWAVGECLKKVDSKLSKECSAFIKLQDVCKKDIEAHCAGKEYSGDLLVCLSEWVRIVIC
jgi:Cysteine rich repeat